MVWWLSYGLIMNKVSYEFELCNPWVHHNPNCFNSDLRYNTLTLNFFYHCLDHYFHFHFDVYIQVFGHLHENFGHTKSWNWIVFQFLVKWFQCLISNKILFFFFLTILTLIILCWNFAIFGVTKKWHWFFKNIFLRKHPC